MTISGVPSEEGVDSSCCPSSCTEFAGGSSLSVSDDEHAERSVDAERPARVKA